MDFEITFNGTKVNRIFNGLAELNKGVENLLNMAFREASEFQPEEITITIRPTVE